MKENLFYIILALVLILIILRCEGQFLFSSEEDSSEDVDQDESGEDYMLQAPKFISNMGSNIWGKIFGKEQNDNKNVYNIQTTTTINPNNYNNRDGRIISSSAFNKISETLGNIFELDLSNI